jgi:hypothetical protein
MLLVNAIMVSVFYMAKVFRLIWEVQHIISNFQLIKDMLVVNAIMVSVF